GKTKQMKKTLLVTIIYVMTATGAFGQNAASIAFNDNNGAANSGTYNSTDTFSVDVFLTTNFTSSGFSLWLETQVLNNFNTALTITGMTYFTFTGPTDNGFPKSFATTAGRTNAGFLTDTDTVTNPQTGTIDQGD